jgi:long-chain fatty acid transport protein
MKQLWRSHGKHLRKTLSAAALATFGQQAAAGGLTLYEIGSRDTGLASAGYTARAQDASTVMTNPAGMIRLQGTQAMAGGQLLYGDVFFAQEDRRATLGGNGGNVIGWLPGASGFVSHSLAPDLKVGFGIGSNFGLAEKYNDHWVGRYYGKEAALLGISLLPSVAYRVNERLSVGASINAMYGVFKTEVAVNNIVPGMPDGELKLDDRTWGWGVNLGLLYELDAKTRFGLTYTSQLNLDFNPHTQFRNLGPGLGTALANRGRLNTELDLGVKVPQSLHASVVHEVDPHWTVLGSIGWQQWSKFGKVDVGVDGNDIKETELLFDDTWHAALGAQYHVSERQTFDFGIAYDSDFQDGGNVSPLLPANRTWRVGLGVHNNVDQHFSWGVAAEYAYMGTLDVNKRGAVPVALGGRGDLVGSYEHAGLVFVSAYANWRF